MRLQTTLGRTISVSGVGLHSGRNVHATLRPAPAGRGIAFVRTDVGVVIPAVAEEAGRLDFATSLGEPGREVGTIEHLLSAAVGLGLAPPSVVRDLLLARGRYRGVRAPGWGLTLASVSYPPGTLDWS
jgi:UDP-3-O-acyl-N-acetylglucosamine deacetylase